MTLDVNDINANIDLEYVKSIPEKEMLRPVLFHCFCDISRNMISLLEFFASFCKPFLSVSILYPLKTPHLWFSGIFKGHKMGTSARNGSIPKDLHNIP